MQLKSNKVGYTHTVINDIFLFSVTYSKVKLFTPNYHLTMPLLQDNSTIIIAVMTMTMTNKELTFCV